MADSYSDRQWERESQPQRQPERDDTPDAGLDGAEGLLADTQYDRCKGQTQLRHLISHWLTPRTEKINGNASEGYRPTLHQKIRQWPTSKAGNANGAGLHGMGGSDLQTMVTLWPTPAARDWKNGQTAEATLHCNTLPPSEQMIQAEKAAQTEPLYLNCLHNRGSDELSARVDHPIFPAGPGEAQADWEPPRTIGKGKDLYRRKRLHALGNAVVPAQVYLVFRAIAEAEQ